MPLATLHDVVGLQEKLLAMEAAHRSKQEQQEASQKVAGDWKHYQSPSQVLQAAKAAKHVHGSAMAPITTQRAPCLFQIFLLCSIMASE